MHGCKQALRLAADWAEAAASGVPPARVRTFDCTVTDQPYDLAVVDCAKTHGHDDTGFVWRRPPDAAYSEGTMAKRWVLDTETKGTGAHVVPLSDVVRKPEPTGGIYVPPKPKPSEPPPRRPKAPLTFKVIEVTTKRVLGERLDARATVELLKGVDSVVDVRLYVWEPNLERWRMLTLSETNALWGFRSGA